MGLFDSIKKVLGSTDQPENLLGEKSEKEAEEIDEIVTDPEGDKWNEHLPTTNPPSGEPDTPGEIQAVQKKKGLFGGLFG